MKVSDLRRHERGRGALSLGYPLQLRNVESSEFEGGGKQEKRDGSFLGDLTEKLGFFLLFCRIVLSGALSSRLLQLTSRFDC